jgi:putative N6-adenine-specific DNA methylase
LLGLEEVLKEELVYLRINDTQVLNRAVSFHGDLNTIYTVNHWSRLTLRVLVTLRETEIHNEKDLYFAVKEIPWEEIFTLKDSFAITTVMNTDLFNHSNYPSLKAKDAIADRFRDHFDDRRPNVNPVNPDIAIHLHINQKKLIISLDSSGYSLHNRGYRIGQGDAPINEVLAAGIIKLSGWDMSTPLWDPMCGSGTICIEAAMMTHGIAPRLHDRYSFMKWQEFDDQLWQQVKALKMEKDGATPSKIYGSDKSLASVKHSEMNAAEAGLLENIDLTRKDFLKATEPEAPCHIIFNPPYDERLEVEDLHAFYRSVGRRFAELPKGCKIWMISSDTEAMDAIELTKGRDFDLMNGSIPVVLREFVID